MSFTASPSAVTQMFLFSFTIYLRAKIVVIVGARRVNAGEIKPGVILAFLTYFNMILMGVMGLNRIFMMMSKADASAKRIQAVVDSEEELTAISEEEAATTTRSGYIVFDLHYT